MDKQRLQELAGVQLNETDEALYKAISKALHPIYVKLGGVDDDTAKDAMTAALREYMQNELTY